MLGRGERPHLGCASRRLDRADDKKGGEQMSTRILLTVPDDLYQRVEEVALDAQRNVEDLLLESITRSFFGSSNDPNRSDMDANVAAYHRLHRQLAEMYLGQYVAVHQGRLVDHDPDPVALLRRVRSQFPGQTVLRRKVEAVAERALRIRHPRIEVVS